MSWTAFHSESEALASAAHEALARRDAPGAAQLFQRAALAEEKALDAMGRLAKPRTLGITAISAVALWYKQVNWMKPPN